MKQLIEQVERHIRNAFPTDPTGHDWHHIDRVRKLALLIARSEGGNSDLIELGALLHDISDHKFNGGSSTEGGYQARDLLLRLGADEASAQTVMDIVNSVSYKGALVADTTTTLEAKIVQDADRLDALGAIGIARTFAYGGHVGQPIYEPGVEPVLHTSFEAYKSGRTHTINHFHEKLLLLEQRLHTETALEIGRKRTQIMVDFLTDFHNEWTIFTEEL